jgi:transposase
MPRKPYQSDLTDPQWRYLQRLVPRPARTGRPRADEREVVNGILYVLHTGCRWEDMPHDIQASPKTCHRRLLEYQRRRVWQRMVAELMKEADRRGLLNLKNCYHDASVVKSKKGQKKKLATQENTGLTGSNATS